MDTLVYFVYIPSSGVIIALIIAWLFIRKSKYLIGYLYGLIPILGLWLVAEWWVISACMACGSQGLCCEGTGIGVVTYAFLALIAVAIYSALVFGIAFLHKRLFADQYSTSTQDIYPATKNARVPYVLLVLGVTAFLGGFVTQKIVDLANRGLFIGWHRAEESEKIKTALEAGNVQNILITRGLCIYEFVASQPIGRVVKKASIMSCSAASRHETRYALLEDGSYWMWKHEINSDLTLLISNVISTVAGSIAGLFGGVFMSSRIWKNTKSVAT
ncbi:MAG: hypothetical protein HUU38_09835 [Anaerolineales bacterium]|nr:hypothetical protein [Anaerolineales bacterium]